MEKVKKLVKYKLWLQADGTKIIPPYILDGGYYFSQTDGYLYGIMECDNDVYISPNAVIEVTESELVERIKLIRQAGTPMPSPDMNITLPTPEVEAHNFISERL
jgi:hypothetical protein